jgi:hypothetical protein
LNELDGVVALIKNGVALDTLPSSSAAPFFADSILLKLLKLKLFFFAGVTG